MKKIAPRLNADVEVPASRRFVFGPLFILGGFRIVSGTGLRFLLATRRGRYSGSHDGRRCLSLDTRQNTRNRLRRLSSSRGRWQSDGSDLHNGSSLVNIFVTTLFTILLRNCNEEILKLSMMNYIEKNTGKKSISFDVNLMEHIECPGAL
jgi:hypothetical protein